MLRVVLLASVFLFGTAYLLFGAWWRTSDSGGGDGAATLLPAKDAPKLASTAEKPADGDAGARARVAAGHLMDELRQMDEQAQATLLANRVISTRDDAMPFSRELVRHLVSLLTSETEHLAHYASSFLRRMGPRVVPSLHPLLASDASERAKSLAMSLIVSWYRQDPTTVALPPLLPLLSDDSLYLKQLTMRLVTRGVPYEEALAQRLLQMHRDKPIGGPGSPETGLARMGPQAVALLVDQTRAENVNERVAAMHGLGAARPEDLKPHLPLLAAQIADPEEHMGLRIAAILALRTMRGDCLECLDALRATMAVDSYDLVKPSLTVLHAMGPRAAPAVPDILRWLGETDPRLVDQTAATLGAIRARPDLVLPALGDVITRQGSDAAAKAMGAFGAAAYDHAARILEEGDEYARYSILWTFAALGEGAAPIVPRLISLIEGDDPDISMRAVGTLGYIGPKAAAGVPAVMALLRQGQSVLPTRSAAATLMRLGPAAEAALAGALKSGDETDRRRALSVLTHFHVRTAFALDDLAVLAKGRDARMRADAIDAVGAALFDPRDPLTVYRLPDDEAVAARVRAILELATQDTEAPVRERATRYLAWLDARK